VAAGGVAPSSPLFFFSGGVCALFFSWPGGGLYHEKAPPLPGTRAPLFMRLVRGCVVGGGSSGGCPWGGAGRTGALFDCGLPLRETRRRCLDAGLPFRELTDVFLTHEHADHAYAAGMLARKLGVRVHATRGTWRALRDPPPPSLRHAVRAGMP